MDIAAENLPLNEYISFSGSADDGSDKAILEQMASEIENPENLYMNKENYLSLEYFFANDLTELEKKVLESYVSGLSYKEIAERLGKTSKSVDGTIQRIRKKLGSYIDNNL